MADLRHKKHIFFDLDDTLWDFRANSSVVLRALFAEYGLAGKLDTDVETFLRVYARLNLAMWSKYYRLEIDKHALRNNRFRLLFREFNYENDEESLRFSADYIARAPHGRQLKEGCIPVLDYLKSKYTLHLITNGFTEVQAIKIDGCALRPYFKNIIISEEHELVKPDTRIFRLAETMSAASAAECVMIGDNFEADVCGGLNAGWDVIFFSDEMVEGYNGLQIGKLEELRNYL